MRRAMIIGGSGSGKSTLAREIGGRLGLPVVHMDSLFWEPGWVEAEEAVFLKRVAEATAMETWVMDGNYSRTWPDRLKRADTVIFLDVPGWKRVLRTLWRSLRGLGKTRPDLAEDCPEKIDLGFIFGWVLQYRRNGRPKALSLMAADGPAAGLKRYHLRHSNEVEALLRNLEANADLPRGLEQATSNA